MNRKMFAVAFAGALLGALVSPVVLEVMDELAWAAQRQREARDGSRYEQP